MSITYPLESPAQFGFTTITWGPMTNTARAKALWTFQDVTQVFAGEMWMGQLSIALRKGAAGRELVAWIASLKGTRGTFKLGDPAAAAPLGSAADEPGEPLVYGAGQTGSQLMISGLPVNADTYLLAGDMIQLGTFAAGNAHLHMVLTDVSTSGTDRATLDLFPALRVSPANGSPVVLDNPRGVFALSQPFTPWQVRSPLLYDNVVLPVMEVIP